MFDRLDQQGRRVLEAAVREAVAQRDTAVGTEHLLLALAAADPVTARLLGGATGGVDLRAAVLGRRSPQPARPADHETLLATLGIDLVEIRQRAEDTFGADAVTHAALQARPAQPRRPIWSWISCSTPLRRRDCNSPLAGQQIALIPRVKRVLERASRAARPGLASPSHLLLVVITGNEPAGEVLTTLGVDLDALAEATRRTLRTNGTTRDRAS